MSLVGPFGNDIGAQYLGELMQGHSLTEIEGVLAADSSGDRELAQEQHALAAVIAAIHDPAPAPRAAATVARQLHGYGVDESLYSAAHGCVNRLLNNPFSDFWKDHGDGLIGLRREVRALRARLHRACGG